MSRFLQIRFRGCSFPETTFAGPTSPRPKLMREVPGRAEARGARKGGGKGARRITRALRCRFAAAFLFFQPAVGVFPFHGVGDPYPRMDGAAGS